VEEAPGEDQAAFMLQENLNLLILDGPMTYMLGYRYYQENLRSSIENINKIIRSTSVKSIIADHHLLRDINYRERFAAVYECALNNGVHILNAAQYVGHEAICLRPEEKNCTGVNEI
jgi:predicted metallo-beta-lactamase superfamily hydrolase